MCVHTYVMLIIRNAHVSVMEAENSITLTITYISTNLFIVLRLHSEIRAVTIQQIGICILHARCSQYIAVLQYRCGYY